MSLYYMKLMRSSLNKKGGFTKGLSRYSGISTFNMILIILFGIFLIVYSYRYAYNYINKNSTYNDNGSSGNKNSTYNDNGSSGNKNVTIDNSVDDIKLILFYAEWCPHCKAIKNDDNSGEWDLFIKEYGDGYVVDGKTIVIHEHEASVTNNNIDPNNYNIKGYPSIVLDINGKHYHYETKITKNRLEEFVKQTLTYKPTIIDKIISFISFTN